MSRLLFTPHIDRFDPYGINLAQISKNPKKNSYVSYINRTGLDCAQEVERQRLDHAITRMSIYQFSCIILDIALIWANRGDRCKSFNIWSCRLNNDGLLSTDCSYVFNETPRRSVNKDENFKTILVSVLPTQGLAYKTG